MQFNVAQLLKEQTGSTRRYEVEERLDDLDPVLVIQSPISGWVKFTKIPVGILVVGELRTTVEVNCTRCLEPFDTEVTVELEEEFRAALDLRTGATLPEDEEADEATRIDDKHLIDLTEVLRQALLLALPSSPVCRPDCAGLCPQCGANLNDGPCGCPQEEVDPRWEALRALLDPAGESPSEET